MLDEIRIGSCSEKTLAMLQQRKQSKDGSLVDEDGILPTMLYAKNIQVDDINKQQLAALTGKKVKNGGLLTWKKEKWLFLLQLIRRFLLTMYLK